MSEEFPEIKIGKMKLILIGHPQKKPWGLPYINLLGPNEEHIGSIKDKDLKRLRRWAKDCLGVKA